MRNNKNKKNKQKNQDRGGWKGKQTDGVLQGVVITNGPRKAHHFLELRQKGAIYVADKNGVPQLFQSLTRVPDTQFDTAVMPTVANWTTIVQENKVTPDKPNMVDKTVEDKTKRDMMTRKYIMMAERDAKRLDQFKTDQA